jgi:hypothetical protein
VLVENEVLEVLARVFPLNVELRLVEQGIAVKHANQPQVERIVKMPIDVRDRVWEWIQNPKVVTEKEWVELREPITLVIFEIAKVIWQYSSPLQREMLSRMLKELSQSR